MKMERRETLSFKQKGYFPSEFQKTILKMLVTPFHYVYSRVVENCIHFLVKNRDKLSLHELDKRDLEKSKGGLNPLYWKMDDGKKVANSGPTLYAKVICHKKQEKILSLFFDEDEKEIEPLSLIGKYCFAKAAIKIESIFINGSKAYLQVKLWEVNVEVINNKLRRLSRPKADPRVHAESEYEDEDEEEDDE